MIIFFAKKIYHNFLFGALKKGDKISLYKLYFRSELIFIK